MKINYGISFNQEMTYVLWGPAFNEGSRKCKRGWILDNNLIANTKS